MAVNLESSNVATRENRIGSITGYIGSLSDLAYLLTSILNVIIIR